VCCCLHLQGASFTSTQPARVAACLERVAAATPSLMDKSALPSPTHAAPLAGLPRKRVSTLAALLLPPRASFSHATSVGCSSSVPEFRVTVWPRSVGRPCLGASLCVTPAVLLLQLAGGALPRGRGPAHSAPRVAPPPAAARLPPSAPPPRLRAHCGLPRRLLELLQPG
jgi:hypothetical protein